MPTTRWAGTCGICGLLSVLPLKRPSFVGPYTNDFVYEPLAPGVLEELNRVNRVLPRTKRRKHEHHQWLTPEVGQLCYPP